jgi:hypothetical protein
VVFRAEYVVWEQSNFFVLRNEQLLLPSLNIKSSSIDFAVEESMKLTS